ncbi:MAG TPA: hypothetical protein VG870_07250 [Chitinophagaceae bacterium]|nr:hypothetical protein [Chitinophagaceae bacterium]
MQIWRAWTAALLLGTAARAQVPVRWEPHHHNLFENDRVRILDVRLGPGDTSAYHVHRTPSVFITLTHTRTGSQLRGRPPATSGYGTAGSATYDSLVIPRIHRVWNEDSTWFHVMDIELTGQYPSREALPLTGQYLQGLFQGGLANGYRLNLPAGATWVFPSTTSPCLLVSTDSSVATFRLGTDSQTRYLQPGHFQWLEAGCQGTIRAAGALPVEAILLQLK